MRRALLLVGLIATSASAQVQSYVNPYNPYVSSATLGPMYAQPYVSLDRLHLQYQSRAMPSSFAATAGTLGTGTNSATVTSRYQQYPNYPSLNGLANSPISVGGFSNTAAKGLQPLPLTAPRPVETACDPYLSSDGCLSEIAGWGGPGAKAP